MTGPLARVPMEPGLAVKSAREIFSAVRRLAPLGVLVALLAAPAMAQAGSRFWRKSLNKQRKVTHKRTDKRVHRSLYTNDRNREDT